MTEEDTAKKKTVKAVKDIKETKKLQTFKFKKLKQFKKLKGLHITQKASKDMSTISEDSHLSYHQHRQFKHKNLNEDEKEQSNTDTDINHVNHHIKCPVTSNCNEFMILSDPEDKASGSHPLSQKKVETVVSVEVQDDSQNKSGSKTFCSHSQPLFKKKFKKNATFVRDSVKELKSNHSSHLH